MPLTNSPYSVSGDRKASSHKEWLEGMVAYCQMTQRLLSDLLGGQSDGIISVTSVGTDSYKVHESTVPSMTVKVAPGWGFYDGELFELASEQSIVLNAPSADDRIDALSVNPEDGQVDVTEGVEASSPSAPSTPSGQVKIAEVYHRYGESSVKDSDDASNGYITLKRLRLNFGGQE